MQIWDWAKSHPVEAGAIVFVGGLAAIFLLRAFSGGGGSSPSGDPNAAAYYAAESAQGQAGDALQAVQIQSQAQTAQTQIAADASVTNNTTWAGTDLATTQSNNATLIATAPYALQNNLISSLAGVASIPGATVTTQSSESDGGFFGLGASTSSSTNSVYQPNPAALDASGLLKELVTNGYHPSS